MILNPTAQALGRMARGIPKRITDAERQARRDRMARARALRWPGRHPHEKDRLTQ